MHNLLTAERARSLDDMIGALEQQIKLAQKAHCEDALHLLRITKLSLQMERHAISESELKAFCTELEAQVSQTESPESVVEFPTRGARPPRVMVGLDAELPAIMQGRRNLLFRVQDRRISRRRARIATARVGAHQGNAVSRDL